MTKEFRIVTHNDLDGGSSAICVINHLRQKYGDYKCVTSFRNYQNVNPYVDVLLQNAEKYEKIFITDISVSTEIADHFTDNVILLDHHDTAKHLDGKKGCIVDTSGNHCGASMCYKHLLKDQGFDYEHLKKLVAVTLDYDLWHLKLPKNAAKNLNFIFYKYWGEDFIKRFSNGFDKYTQEEVDYLVNKWKEIEEEIKTTEFIDVIPEHKNKFCLFVLKNNKGEVNEVCDHALNVLNYDIVMSINAKQKKLSIRATKRAEEKGFHVGEMNVELGIGGGHSRAGGATFEDDDHLEKICERYAERILSLDI